MRVVRLSRLGVRSRTTLTATAVVASVLALSGWLLVMHTRSALYHSVQTTVTARAADVAAQVRADGSATQVPFVRGISVQVVVDGVVVASTADIEGQRPIMDLSDGNANQPLVVIPALDSAENQDETGGDEGEEGPFLVATNSTPIDGRVHTVLAAASLDSVDNATRALLPLIALGVPAITALVALVVSGLTRRAFRPIDEMTRQTEAISYSDLHLRIPEPEPDDEIRRLAVVLNRMLDRLDASVSRQREFIADASHELKSPIATLLTMAEVAESSPGDLELGELAADVAGQSSRLAALVEDLLTVAQSDERGLRLHRESFDIAQLVVEELELAPLSGFAVDIEHLASVMVYADRGRMGQVVRNLLDNARHHASSRIVIQTGVVDGRTVLRIADDGAGIDPADRERVFDRFVRLDEARSRQTGGTGLGLSVVRSIVDAHRGTVTVGDDPSLGGAVVTVSLSPASDPDRSL